MKCWIAGCIAVAAFAQQPEQSSRERVLQFVQTDSAQGYQEIATAVRSVTDIPFALVSPEKRTFAIRGTSEQVALAEWLFTELDRSSSAAQGSGSQYRIPGSPEDRVRVFYLAHARTPETVQDISTTVRSLGDIPRVFTYFAPRALIVRGTAAQLELADWLVASLDRPAAAKAEPRHHTYPQAPDDTVRVFYFASAPGAQNFQEMATVIRSTTDIRRLFVCNVSGALALRGTADQVALADWLFKQLDTTPNPQRSALEYSAPGPAEMAAVRILYGSPDQTVQQFQQGAVDIRKATSIRRFFTYTPTRAMIVRGTADQAAQAEKLAASAN